MSRARENVFDRHTHGRVNQYEKRASDKWFASGGKIF